MSKHQYDSANTVCRDAGHDWLLVGTSWRMCQRERCRASQHLQDGVWTSNAAFYRQHVPVETEGTRQYLRRQGRQRSLWEPEGGQS